MLKIVLDDYITNLDGDLFCDYPLCTPGNYDCRGSQVLVCDVSGVAGLKVRAISRQTVPVLVI
jgi:hypothetical protein